jgi:hypothetical protein
MTSPTPRYAETSNADADIKEPPCGRTNGTRTKDAARITTFRPGETIKIAFKETIDHDGYFRVAFDDDGQNAFTLPKTFVDVQATPVLPVLLDGIPDESDKLYEVEVTLPNVTCNNCTLQLIQVMQDGAKDNATVTVDDVYFTCADIVIAGEPVGTGGATGQGGTSSVAGAGGKASTGGSASSGGSQATGGSSGRGGSGGTSSTAGRGGANAAGTAGNAALLGDDTVDDDSGCSVGLPSRTNYGGWAIGALMAGLMLLRRKRGRKA